MQPAVAGAGVMGVDDGHDDFALERGQAAVLVQVHRRSAALDVVAGVVSRRAAVRPRAARLPIRQPDAFGQMQEG